MPTSQFLPVSTTVYCLLLWMDACIRGMMVRSEVYRPEISTMRSTNKRVLSLHSTGLHPIKLSPEFTVYPLAVADSCIDGGSRGGRHCWIDAGSFALKNSISNSNIGSLEQASS